MEFSTTRRSFLASSLAAGVAANWATARESSMFAADELVTLVDQGQAKCAIYVEPSVLESKERVKLRDAVHDLATYLERMSGAKIPLRTGPPGSDAPSCSILIGALADSRWGRTLRETPYRQSARLVTTRSGVGLQGETDEGICYAIYELLDSLGCRWYIPGELGEVVPRRATLTTPVRDLTIVPGTISRNIWYADDAFKRRNRLGGFQYHAGHALESYVTEEQLKQYPEWNAEMGGKRQLHKCDVGYRICWAREDVAAAIAERIVAQLDQTPAACVSVSPGDGIDFCECANCKALDADDFDPSMNCISLTDRYVHFVNWIAERVARKHPAVTLGFLAYAQYTRPPRREKLHPNLIPQLAPITYCRAHTLDDPQCKSRQQIRQLLEGWGKASERVAMYEYFYHLAEVAAPFPAIRRNLVESRVQYANHVSLWTPETLSNFESHTPGLCLGIRMAWNPQADPAAILAQFYREFYGAAAMAMGDYWQYLDDCWTTSPEHAGCGFGYLRRFPPDRLAEARRRIDLALRACQTPLETRRVTLADESFRQLELFMKLRRDYFAGRASELVADSQRWMATHRALADKYQENFTFTKAGWAPDTVAVNYFKAFYLASYEDLARLHREFQVATPTLNVWKFAVDREQRGATLGWDQTAFDDAAWRTTDVAFETWSTLELDSYFGPVWYRARVTLPAIPAGKKVWLWVGATDGACRVYMNGQPGKHVDAKGATQLEPSGFCQPFSFDVTEAVKSNAANSVVIVGTRQALNELGTGGLLGPAVVYCER